MLSILIPTHNYDVTALVKQLHEQISKTAIKHEIIVYDNGSIAETVEKNKKINTLKNVELILSEKNIGISVAREFLSEKAKYDWILLLDADTQLKYENYILNYTNYLNTEQEVVFGGFAYENKKPDKNESLRWKYGMKHENVSAKKRNKNPYKITIAGNLLIKKEIYQSFNLHYIGDAYGMDLYLGPQLKKNKVSVLHIDNEVYHLGLENNEKYLRKVEIAIVTLLKLYKRNFIDKHENDLLFTYEKLKQTKLNYLFSLFYTILKHPIKLNLLSGNPSIKLLQLYKIFYLCHYDLIIKNY
jgi:hypothetical protein